MSTIYKYQRLYYRVLMIIVINHQDDCMTLPPIKVHVGETFDCSVPSNPGSTGFACVLAKMPECVYLVSMIYVPGLGAPGMVGVPGNEIFKFVAVSEGSGAIEFKHVKFSKPLEIYPKDPDMTHQMEYRFVIVEK
jgi:inhibitor of cysteine peptidase